jgi:hypothetical protein
MTLSDRRLQRLRHPAGRAQGVSSRPSAAPPIGLEGVYLVCLDKVTWDEEMQHGTIVHMERSEAR